MMLGKKRAMLPPETETVGAGVVESTQGPAVSK